MADLLISIIAGILTIVSAVMGIIGVRRKLKKPPNVKIGNITISNITLKNITIISILGMIICIGFISIPKLIIMTPEPVTIAGGNSHEQSVTGNSGAVIQNDGGIVIINPPASNIPEETPVTPPPQPPSPPIPRQSESQPLVIHMNSGGHSGSAFDGDIAIRIRIIQERADGGLMISGGTIDIGEKSEALTATRENNTQNFLNYQIQLKKLEKEWAEFLITRKGGER
ncbi:MAG: hypothetical protein LBQ67_03250 [Treponema sp.]|nr:hypothetical protein [Treponema sp.]